MMLHGSKLGKSHTKSKVVKIHSSSIRPLSCHYFKEAPIKKMRSHLPTSTVLDFTRSTSYTSRPVRRQTETRNWDKQFKQRRLDLTRN